MEKPEKQELFDNGYIIDVEDDYLSGRLITGKAASCYPAFDNLAPECKICFVSEQCASRAISKIHLQIKKVAKAAVTVKPIIVRKTLQLPTTFKDFESAILKLPHVVRYAKLTLIRYGYERKKFFDVINPISDTNIILKLYNCIKPDFGSIDEKCRIWDNDPQFPHKPFLFVMSQDWEYEFQLLKYLHSLLSATSNTKIKKSIIFNEERYVSHKRQLRKKNKKAARQA